MTERNKFEHGHAYHPPAHDERGLHAPIRKAQRELANLIDEMVDFRVVVERMLQFAVQGKDQFGQTIDAALQFAAQKYLMERRFGSTPQAVYIDARMASMNVNLTAGNSDPLARVEEMPDEDLEQLEGMLARLGIAAPGPEPVVDAESTEKEE